MKSWRLSLLVLLLLAPAEAWSQQATRTEPVTALRDNAPGVHAFTGARIVVSPGRVLDNATLVVRDGVIEAVGTGVRVPADAREWPMAGRTLYAGFIDAHGDLEIDAAPPEGERDPGPVHWNPQVRADFSAAGDFRDDAARRSALRSQGFTTVHAVPRLGIFRGRTAVVSLGDGPARERVLRPAVGHSLSLSGSRELGGSYPNSPMGAIALVRQTLLDADWYIRVWDTYRRAPRGLQPPETNAALASLDGVVQRQEPLIVETRSEEELLRARAIAEEFPVALWLRGSGEEYRILDVLTGLTVPLVLPLDFPEAPDVESPEEALDADLDELRHWYLAPENPARVASAGVQFALTADALDDVDDFLPNLRAAVERGLSRDVALASLTVNPARMLDIASTHGTLEAGKLANIVITNGDLFDDDTEVRDVWVQGERYVINPDPAVDPRGQWIVASSDDARLNGRLTVTGTPNRLRGTVTLNGQPEVTLSEVNAGTEAGRLHVAFPGSAIGTTGVVRLSGSISGDEAYGWSALPDGTNRSWRAERTERTIVADNTNGGDGNGNGNGNGADGHAPALVLPDIRPAVAFGRARLPEQPEHVLIRNATVWTQGPQGRIDNADLLVTRGKVTRVGRGLDAPSGATIVDATGKHVTPGLIDAHVHTSTSGTNESGFAIVPEVRMGDVVTHNSIDMYHQLAGGLTLGHVMHGSANPIGGQNVFLKMRWGALPDQLKLEDAPRTVKFALGENPKRREDRYPDTRMGTQQIIRDHFMAARDYERAWQQWERNREGLPPRRDLRMEALVDILNEDLRVQSHGYRQDEFLALVRLAEEFDFSIQALQHAVEAYKIAPELAASGVAAVVWSDWSSFKVEAYDGTPYNAKILLDAGVLTSLHSDDGQISSRMNWEAGKMLRTGIGEEDALSLVTNRTAAVFGLEDRVGSLQPGFDADFVIWNGHPLSQFTRAEQTWIDGRRYFDLAQDMEERARVQRERAQLIQLILGDDDDNEAGGSR
ncbi:MAG TPA: amidohydrolase family protein [Longimicrobiales bacterium]|nr:amidohydrolase family protein [Longimicrobiales bacterium]